MKHLWRLLPRKREDGKRFKEIPTLAKFRILAGSEVEWYKQDKREKGRAIAGAVTNPEKKSPGTRMSKKS